ncbi:hypothetical protein GCM10023153_01890 [Ornithinibacter aureus]|uniref:Mutator family transposase n=1 Tax=Ornithinibacter aureus TaxID=622664 RepID=A0ABP8J9U4_9MICO
MTAASNRSSSRSGNGACPNSWEQIIPFLDRDIEIRKVLCSTNAIESLKARYRRAVNAKGHFPTEQAAFRTLYLVTRSLDPKGRGQARWVTRWKPALNAFAITFADRMPAAENSNHANARAMGQERRRSLRRRERRVSAFA